MNKQGNDCDLLFWWSSKNKSMRPLAIVLSIIITIYAHAQPDRTSIIQSVEKLNDAAVKAASDIWSLAELGYQEHKSTAILQGLLTDAGFKVTKGVAEIPTAFVAEYGSGSPVIGILAEFDALPGFSQAATPYIQAEDGQSNGHACGHHLFGAASSTAGIAIKEWLQSTGRQGTIRVYGTPAEEGGAGKVYMVRAGLLDDVDVMLHWHPSSRNNADARSSLANKSGKFRFYGEAAHASAAPHRGRSALDGVEAMNMMVNMMREHMLSDSRVHYVITQGGHAPNVVPSYAEVYYYVRHPEMNECKALFERVVKAAEGAAMGTETKMEYEVIHGIYNLLPNEVLAKVVHKNLTEIGGVEYTAEEVEFANSIISTFPNSESKPKDAMVIDPFQVVEKGTGGSTDVGDVSWAVPTVGLGTATWVPGTSAHSWQAVAAGGMSIGHKGMINAAKVLALTAYDIYTNPQLVIDATAELNKRRGADFKYEALLGDRPPPLDYRN